MKEKILLQCERIYEVQNLIKWMLTASFYDGSPLNQKAYFKSCLEQRLKDLINEVVILDDAINKY